MLHESIGTPDGAEEVALVEGQYDYYHYKCDDVDDRGWGCGYRTLQTLCSWVRHQHILQGKSTSAVPGLRAIQVALVEMYDKPPPFIGSRDWIGSVEVGLCVDYFYEVPCKILHATSGHDLIRHGPELLSHFREKGAPVMMGGNTDNASKGIMGVVKTKSSYSLLILDPHYVGPPPDGNTLAERNMLLWRPLESFQENSFYNLCLPQLARWR